MSLCIAACLLLATLGLGGGPALAQTHESADALNPASPITFTPNFKDVDITVIAEAVSRATGTVIILGPGVRGTFSIVNIKPITPSVFYLEFLAMLKSEGLRADRSGTVIKITVDKTAHED